MVAQRIRRTKKALDEYSSKGFRGFQRIRTAVAAFAELCLTARPGNHFQNFGLQRKGLLVTCANMKPTSFYFLTDAELSKGCIHLGGLKKPLFLFCQSFLFTNFLNVKQSWVKNYNS
jgi:hypothetical protein